MNRILLSIFAALTIAVPALADNPTLFAPGPGGPPIEGGRDVCWSEPGDPTFPAWTSEVIGELDLVTESANDFVIDVDATITLARWWGTYWGGDPADYSMNLRFYAEDGCVPTNLLAEWMNLDANQSDLGNGTFAYTYPLSFAVTAGTRYWFVAQAADHAPEVQWGRLSASTLMGCHSMFRSEYFAFPDWSVVWWPIPDLSQEFECEAGTAAARTTWGAVKALYR